MKDDEDPDKLKQQLQLVNMMAKWMPWVAVILSILTTTLIILYAINSR